jgi:hypothetical protein
LKKFSNEYLNDFDKLKDSVIGFEFEFYTKKSYYKLMEYLGNQLDPIKIHGFRKYHSKFKPDEDNFKIEPDLSGGYEMIELVSGPIPYVNAKIILLKILKILQDIGKTDERCSVHVNISFDGKKSEKILGGLNRLKLILNVDEDFIYRSFPTREDNIYAKSVKSIIPFKGFDYSNDAANILINNLELPDTKYYGINIQAVDKGRLEYRYIGGKDYQYKTAEILSLMDYFIALTWNSIDESLDEEDMEELREYLFENINMFKSFSSYEDFISNFPTIDIQVDRLTDYAILKAYYDNFYDEVYDLVQNTYNLSNCILNFDTQQNRLELVDADFRTIFDIDRLDIIDSTANSGRYNSCNLVSTEVVNGNIKGGSIVDCNILNSKIEGSKIDNNTEVNDSYLYQCHIDGHITGDSVLRFCKLGPNAIIDDSVRIVTDRSNYFNTTMSSSTKKDTGVPEIPKTKGKKW